MSKNNFRKLIDLSELNSLVHLAVPLIIAQLGQVSMVFVDTVMMGMLGTEALAGGGLGASVFSFAYMIAVGIISVVGNLVAHAHGAGNKAGVSNAVKAGFIVSIILACLWGFLLWHSAFLLRLLGQSETNITLAESFLRAVLWSVAPGLWFITLRGFTAGLSQPGPISVIVVGASIVNIVLNDFFIHGRFGFPKLGVAGIGCSTSFVFLIMFIALTISVKRQPRLASYRIFSHFKQVRIQSLLEVVRLGLPIGLTYGVESALFTIAALLMGLLGTSQLAAHQIAERTVYIAYMLPVGIYQAVSILVGRAFGLGHIEKARTIGRLGLLLGGICECTIALFFWLMSKQIVGLYIQGNNDENVVTGSLAMKFLTVAALFLIFDGSQIIMSGAIQGLKDSKSTMIISVVGYWVVGLPTAYFLAFVKGSGGLGIWWGLSLGLASASVLMIIYFEFKTKHLLKLKN
ncbi:MAG: NorM family multidrug efflux MATE transporter [Crocosphaera sp.]